MDKTDKAFLKVVENVFKVTDEKLRADILISLQDYIATILKEK